MWIEDHVSKAVTSGSKARAAGDRDLACSKSSALMPVYQAAATNHCDLTAGFKQNLVMEWEQGTIDN